MNFEEIRNIDLTSSFWQSNSEGNISEKYFQKDERRYQTKYGREQNSR